MESYIHGYKTGLDKTCIVCETKEDCEFVKKLLSSDMYQNADTVVGTYNNDSLRGLFDACGDIDTTKTQPTCTLYIPNHLTSQDLEIIAAAIKPIPFEACKNSKHWTFKGSNCVDFLGNLYGKQNTTFCLPSKKQQFERLMISTYGTSLMPICKVYKDNDCAIVPSKAKESDAGYDLTIISKAKQLTKTTALYDTGIKIKIDHGYYAEVVPRSSISKSGYMLANSIGIIDNSYNGNIYIALAKIDESMPDIEFPFRCAQLIFRKQVNVCMHETSEMFEETARGEGGFGSSGK